MFSQASRIHELYFCKVKVWIHFSITLVIDFFFEEYLKIKIKFFVPRVPGLRFLNVWTLTLKLLNCNFEKGRGAVNVREGDSGLHSSVVSNSHWLSNRRQTMRTLHGFKPRASFFKQPSLGTAAVRRRRRSSPLFATEENKRTVTERQRCWQSANTAAHVVVVVFSVLFSSIWSVAIYGLLLSFS